MEKKFKASADTVFALLTDPQWLQARCLALGELSASVKAKKSAGSVTLAMQRRVRRELPSVVAKVMSPETELVVEETWSAPDASGARKGRYTMDAVGQPVKVTAEFTLTPAGKGCEYRIAHHCKSDMFLIGKAIESFAMSQIQSGCANELDYLAGQLKGQS